MAAQGTATLNFGAFPGASDASVAVTGQAGILAGSLVEAWILPATTADHTADEHMVEEIMIFAGSTVAGTGFTIYGIHRPSMNEPVRDQPREQSDGRVNTEPAAQSTDQGGRGTRIYGAWNIGWVWS